MALSLEPTSDALRGAAQVRDTFAENFAAPDAAREMLAYVSTIFNSIVYLTITACIVVFFFYLILWTTTQLGTEKHSRASKGAVRGFVSLFLMVSIWGIIRALDRIVFFSPLTEYLAFVLFFVALAAWTYLNLGKSLFALLSHAAVRGSQWIVLQIRMRFPNSTRIVGMDDTTLRLAVIVLVCLIALPFSIYWMITPTSPVSPEQPEKATVSSFSEAVIRNQNEYSLVNNTYTNSRYGISVTYPKDWNVSLINDPDHDGLVWAYNDSLHAYSRLNAGVFSDLEPRSHDSYLEAFWRVSKNMHATFASESSGIMWTQTSAINDIASSSATQLDFVAFWPKPDGSTDLYHDHYLMFGHGPVYFTLQFGGRFNNDIINLVKDDMAAVIQSIKITESQL